MPEPRLGAGAQRQHQQALRCRTPGRAGSLKLRQCRMAYSKTRATQSTRPAHNMPNGHSGRSREPPTFRPRTCCALCRFSSE